MHSHDSPMFRYSKLCVCPCVVRAFPLLVCSYLVPCRPGLADLHLPVSTPASAMESKRLTNMATFFSPMFFSAAKFLWDLLILLDHNAKFRSTVGLKISVAACTRCIRRWISCCCGCLLLDLNLVKIWKSSGVYCSRSKKEFSVLYFQFACSKVLLKCSQGRTKSIHWVCNLVSKNEWRWKVVCNFKKSTSSPFYLKYHCLVSVVILHFWNLKNI